MSTNELLSKAIQDVIDCWTRSEGKVSISLMGNLIEAHGELKKLAEQNIAPKPEHHTAKDFLGKWCPDYDPITLDPFFMWIENESGEYVPTYGGPLDSYTLSQPYQLKEGSKRIDIEYHRTRFCHDRGCWIESETLCMRVASEEFLIDLGVWDEKEGESKVLNIDPGNEQFELARSLHRVVRAMHDGHCPKCGHLASSMEFEPSPGYHACPECEFAITKEEASEALAIFLPYMQKNYNKFVAWQLHGRFVNKRREDSPAVQS